MLLLSPASRDTHFPSSFVPLHWFWYSTLKKEVVLVYFHSSFVVTEDTNSVKSCQHANRCWFLCLLLDYYVDATQYVLNVWFQIAIRDCSRSRPESQLCLFHGTLGSFPLHSRSGAILASRSWSSPLHPPFLPAPSAFPNSVIAPTGNIFRGFGWQTHQSWSCTVPGSLQTLLSATIIQIIKWPMHLYSSLCVRRGKNSLHG